MNHSTFSMNLWRLRIDMTLEFIDSEGRLGNVTVDFYEDGKKIKTFSIKNDLVKVNLKANKEMQSGDEQNGDVIGKMYLDNSMKKIIIEGIYVEKEQSNKLSNFWIEIVPNNKFFNGRRVWPFINDCSKHPLSIGSLSFAVDPVNDNMATPIPNNNNSHNSFTVSIFEEESTSVSEVSKVPYLYAILSPNMKLKGIDTSSIKHDVDFKGDIGFLDIGTRMFIDGDIIVNKTTCCSFYIELH